MTDFETITIILQTIIALSLLVICISTTVFFALLYSKLNPLIDELQRTNQRVRSNINEAEGIVKNVKSTVYGLSSAVISKYKLS